MPAQLMHERSMPPHLERKLQKKPFSCLFCQRKFDFDHAIHNAASLRTAAVSIKADSNQPCTMQASSKQWSVTCTGASVVTIEGHHTRVATGNTTLTRVPSILNHSNMLARTPTHSNTPTNCRKIYGAFATGADKSDTCVASAVGSAQRFATDQLFSHPPTEALGKEAARTFR
jgi:hypothetical protein